ALPALHVSRAVAARPRADAVLARAVPARPPIARAARGLGEAGLLLALHRAVLEGREQRARGPALRPGAAAADHRGVSRAGRRGARPRRAGKARAAPRAHAD